MTADFLILSFAAPPGSRGPPELSHPPWIYCLFGCRNLRSRGVATPFFAVFLAFACKSRNSSFLIIRYIYAYNILLGQFCYVFSEFMLKRLSFSSIYAYAEIVFLRYFPVTCFPKISLAYPVFAVSFVLL